MALAILQHSLVVVKKFVLIFYNACLNVMALAILQHSLVLVKNLK
jgi:3-isopropylmalate dehydratase small subunit